jgi:hypothetical protein
MNPLLATKDLRARARRTGELAAAKILPLLVIVLFLGGGIAMVWFYGGSKQRQPGANPGSPGASAAALSDATRATLQRLSAPVEIRFYDILDPATVPQPMQAFAGRVDQLLAAYQQAADGKIKLTRFGAQAGSSANAAVADGMRPFNQEKGDACYLGIALVLNGHKETLPRLAPEWEQAVEPDVTRAIARLLETAGGPGGRGPISLVNTAAIQQVKTLIPDPAAVSVPQGKEILQSAALTDYKAAAAEMQKQVEEAEQHLKEASISGSAADKEAASKNLQKVQAEQTEKLQQIANRLKAQIDTFQQLRNAPK